MDNQQYYDDGWAEGLLELYDRLDANHEYWGDHIHDLILSLIKEQTKHDS